MIFLDCQVAVNKVCWALSWAPCYYFLLLFRHREIVLRSEKWYEEPVVHPWNDSDASQGEGWIIVRLLFWRSLTTVVTFKVFDWRPGVEITKSNKISVHWHLLITLISTITLRRSGSRIAIKEGRLGRPHTYAFVGQLSSVYISYHNLPTRPKHLLQTCASGESDEGYIDLHVSKVKVPDTLNIGVVFLCVVLSPWTIKAQSAKTISDDCNP
jgi:hypothetical protein